LTYISNTLNGNTILDIGTFNGWSSIALATNKNNRVISFDVLQQHCVASIQESNIEYRVQNILDDSTNEELILCCPFILLDTYHDGTFENEFLHRVVSIGYKGLVMFDDIYLNDSMKSFWNNISLPKHDVTNIGHASGSGIVVFE
jgi:predicted O-methyltransferase YrrM